MRRPTLVGATSTLGAAGVAGVAAWASWSHMVHVALGFGERPEVAYVLPISVDGLLIVSSAAMVHDKRSGRKPRRSAKLAFWIGVVASIGANIEAAQAPIGAKIVAAWPALALLLVVELLSRRGRVDQVDAVDVDPEPITSPINQQVTAPDPIAKQPHPVRTRRARAATGTRAAVAAAMAEHPDKPPAEIAPIVGRSESHVRRVMRALVAEREAVPA